MQLCAEAIDSMCVLLLPFFQLIINFRPPNDSREVLYFTGALFCIPTSNITDQKSAGASSKAHQLWLGGWVLGVARKLSSKIANPPLILQGVQNSGSQDR